MARNAAVTLVAILVTVSLVFLCACDPSVLSEAGGEVVDTAVRESETPVSPTVPVTLVPVTPTPEIISSEPELSTSDPVVPLAAASPSVIQRVEGTVMEDLGGHGRRSTVRLLNQPDQEATIVLMINGREYDTGIPSGTPETLLYLPDLNSDGAAEIMLVRPGDSRAMLYLYELSDEGLKAAAFTYTVPEELSDTGAQMEMVGAPCLIFSGIEPIVSVGDGSFGVLAFGQGFARYLLHDDMQVTGVGALPVNVLTGGDVPPLADASGFDPEE